MGGSIIIFVLAVVALLPLSSAADLLSQPPLVPGSDAARLTTLGDQFYWDGRFGEAQVAYERALALDDRSLAANLGLGRIADLRSDADQARAHYSKAFQTNPTHPEAVLAFASVVTGVARQTLLGNFLTLNRHSTNDDRNSDAVARLAIERKLAGRAVGSVADPHQTYRLALSELRSNNLPSGLLLSARINGGKLLSLQLDSGAQGMVLNPEAGRAAGLEILAGAAMFGFGSEQPLLGNVALAASVEFGTLKIANILAQVSDAKLVPYADGLIGLDVFKDFIIHLNARSRRLDLEPFESSEACGDCSQAYRLDNLLLLQAKINGQAEGNFILDTGSAISLISHVMLAGSGRTTRLEGAQGQQEVVRGSTPVSFRVGSQRFLTFDYGTLDTGRISARYRTSIAGVMGYALLREINLMVDFRRGLVKLSR